MPPTVATVTPDRIKRNAEVQVFIPVQRDEGIQTEEHPQTEEKQSFVQSPIDSPRYEADPLVSQHQSTGTDQQGQKPTTTTADQRMSPGSLKTRLLTELNFLEVIQHSEQQLSALDYTNAIGKAQQETAILAQALQQKQLMQEKEQRMQREIQDMNHRITEMNKRDTHVQTDHNLQKHLSSPSSSVSPSSSHPSHQSPVSDKGTQSPHSQTSQQSKQASHTISEESEELKEENSPHVSHTSTIVDTDDFKLADRVIHKLKKEVEHRQKVNESMVDFKYKQLEEKAKEKITQDKDLKVIKLQLEAERAEIERMKVNVHGCSLT